MPKNEVEPGKYCLQIKFFRVITYHWWPQLQLLVRADNWLWETRSIELVFLWGETIVPKQHADWRWREMYASV